MAHRIDALVDRVQTAPRKPSVDHPSAHAHRQQLPPRHDAVLAIGERRQLTVPRFRRRFCTSAVLN
jgi:hypothetical protein